MAACTSVCAKHCVVVFPRHDLIGCSAETNISFYHDVFNSSSLHQMPDCCQKILSIMEATHAQNKSGILLWVLLLQTQNHFIDGLITRDDGELLALFS